MSGKYNWVCFECRYATRKLKINKTISKCPDCGNDLYCLGYKVAIPKKANSKAWKSMKNCSFCLDITYLEQEAKNKVKEKHQLEKEIIRLENLSDNKENRKALKKLKTRLESLNVRL